MIHNDEKYDVYKTGPDLCHQMRDTHGIHNDEKYDVYRTGPDLCNQIRDTQGLLILLEKNCDSRFEHLVGV
jgi:hypothetical protein